MLAHTILLTLAFSATTLFAQDVDNNDIPGQCSAVCTRLVHLTESCDNQTNNDRDYLSCICNTSRQSTSLPLCEACVSQFDSDGNDNDVNDLLRSCFFISTTYNPSSSYATATLTSIPTTGVTQISRTVTPTSSVGGAVSSLVSSLLPTATAVDQSTNAAPAPTMGARGVGAGVGLGVLGVALGMM